MLSVILIGLSLSLDALAGSVSAGVSIKGLKPFYIIRASFCFGLFQFLMPLIGYAVGRTFISYIEAYDHWIAFALLAFIGGKMLKDALSAKPNSADTADADIRSIGPLLVLAIATSIDALAVGVSFSVTGHNILASAALIGGITFAVCLAGFEFGKRIGRLFEKRAAVAGGLILIALGVKILVEHLIERLPA
ncbi:MAG: manganese efflux pump MntP family protein [Treponema sp.]|jgi:putative Mn2+ efflux pump MntP|nr:manganese efflux pump MntP family protein [Treponema sp.]